MCQFEKLRNIDKPLFSKICDIVNLGEDTDTNAALAGGLLGVVQEIETSKVNKILGRDVIETLINSYIDGLT